MGWDTSWDALEDIGYGYLWFNGKWQGLSVSYASGYAGQIIMLVPDLDLVVVTTAGFPSSTDSGAA